MAATIFVIDEKQEKKLQDWYTSHSCNPSAVQSKNRLISYTFTPSGVGVGVKATCSGCNTYINLSDYDVW